MARYTGPKTKIARKFGEPIYGPDKYLDKKNYPPIPILHHRMRKNHHENPIRIILHKLVALHGG